MGGALRLEPSPRCACFAFELPVGAPQKSGAIPTAPTAPPTRSVRVLVAEDSDVNQRVVRAILERDGHHVRIVENGIAAVQAALAGDIDLILMDIEMPELCGVAATEAIRIAEADTGRRVPIIALIAHAMADARVRFLAAGMDECVTKPFRAPALLATIARAVK